MYWQGYFLHLYCRQFTNRPSTDKRTKHTHKKIIYTCSHIPSKYLTNANQRKTV